MAAARAGGHLARMDVVRDGGGVASARNRLLALGGRACTDEELLGLVLDGGSGGDVARDRAARLLEWAGGVGRLERIDRSAAGTVEHAAIPVTSCPVSRPR